jgi:hypothetical protein
LKALLQRERQERELQQVLMEQRVLRALELQPALPRHLQ